VPHPDVALISKEDRSEDGHGPMTDQGRHVFRYALLPHEGGWSESDLTRAARVFNTPLHHVPGAAVAGYFWSWTRRGSRLPPSSVPRMEEVLL
jgi:alpha-mannosidase